MIYIYIYIEIYIYIYIYISKANVMVIRRIKTVHHITVNVNAEIFVVS